MNASSSAFPYLSSAILVPAGAAVLIALVPSRLRQLITVLSAAAFLGVLGIAAAVLATFKSGVGGFQLVVDHTWIAPLGVSWNLGVDGISLFLLVMTALLFPVAFAGARARENQKAFAVWMLILEAGCIGSFLSLDLLVFFLFFELTLVPVYFLISGWGHERRAFAATKFFLYTFAASALLLVGIITLVFVHQGQSGEMTFNVVALASTRLSGAQGTLLFLAFTAAFVVKAPVFPFHTWSPDAYAEAPAATSALLAGVMAKLGTYGIVRFDLELFPHAVVVLAPLLLTLGVIGIIYGGIVAAVQKDLKRLVAFSSLAHMGFIVVGAFALTGQSLSGAVLQMVNHGLYTAALFLLIAMIYRRSGTFSIAPLKGLQRRAPVLAGVFIVVVLASIGVPGLNGFVGEFLILAGTFLTHRWWAVPATIGVIISAVYLLWGFQQVFHGPTNEEQASFTEMTGRERLVLAPLVLAIAFLGVYPKPVLDRITPSVDALIQHVQQVGHPTIPIEGQPTGVFLSAKESTR